VVGADGMHSTVRQALGMPFPGKSVVRSVMLADVRLSQPPPDTLTLNAAGDAFALIAPFGDGWFRVIAWHRRNQPPEDFPVSLEEVADVARQALGTDYGLHDPRWMSRFHSEERQVPSYRDGRFLLAGAPGAIPAGATAGYGDRVDTAEVDRPTGVVALIRPDAYVAWAYGPASDRTPRIRDALSRWCGK
jgi:FAD binding domain-containing protein/aromatic ring hydroxylase-like protein